MSEPYPCFPHRRATRALSLAAGVLLSAASATPAPARDPRLHEIFAAGNSPLLDEDGDDSDWIEIRNPGPDAAELEGWGLTDRGDLSGVWRFPARSLMPGEHLVVFASGKDRAPAGGELHTHFRLDADGEFLALLRPDDTVAHAFGPFPPQVDGVSWGLAEGVATLVSREAPVDWTVPPSGPLDPAWRGPDFVPGDGWRAGSGGLGYTGDDTGSALPRPLAFWPLDRDLSDTEGSLDGIFAGDGPLWAPGADGREDGALALDGASHVQVPAGGGVPVYGEPAYTVALWVRGEPQNDNRIWSEGSTRNNTPLFTLGTDASGATGRLDVFIRSTASTVVPHRLSDGIVFDGSWHHVAWVDEGGDARLYIDGELDAQDFTYAKPALDLDVAAIGAVLRSSACCGFTGSIDAVGVWDRALDAEQVASLASGTGPGGAGYAAWIGTDVGSALRGEATTLLARWPFEVEDPAGVGTLELELRLDDGAVAWLNGVEVLSANAPAELDGDASATAARTGEEALDPERVALPDGGTLVRQGSNVLAVQGLNVTADDPSFLLAPELRAAGAPGDGRYFEQPTPGRPNGSGLEGIVETPRFGVERGIFEQPFELEITTPTPDVEIRFTTDGSRPTVSGGELYTGPLLVETTTVLRAAAFREGWLASDAASHTYVFPGDVIRQPRRIPGYPTAWAGLPADYAMDPEICTDESSPHYEPTIREDLRSIPTLSIALAPDDFVGPTRGIYTHPLNRGVAWEREGSVELIDPSGAEPGFQVDCGVRMHGNSSARPIEAKHSFRLVFKDAIGPPDLAYALFPDTDVDEFDTLVLRCCSTDAWAFKDGGSRYRRWDSQYIRDVWMRDSQLAMGSVSSHSLYVHLYVNGLYWGLYNPCERPDEDFMVSHFGGEEEDWDVVKDFTESFRGNLSAWNRMMAIADSGLSTQAAYQRIQGRNPDGSPNPDFPDYLEVDNLIDYMILHFWACAEDWPHHNWYAARDRTGAHGGFRFFVWDQEIVLDFQFRDRLDVSNADTPARLYSRLRANEEFRLRFADRVQKHLFHDGALTVDAARERWMVRAREIDRAIVGESARWGDFRTEVPDPSNSPAELYTRDGHWIVEREKVIEQYIPRSRELALERFRREGLYPAVDPPVLSQHGGAIARGDRLTIAAPAGTGWYTLDGGDPRLVGGEVAPGAVRAGPAAPAALLEGSSPARIHVPEDGAAGLEWTRPDFDDADWLEGAVPVGYERQSGYEGLIETDVEPSLYDRNASVYVRIPFEVEDPEAFAILRLGVRYDDGYIAYLNGEEVLRRNAPDDAAWDSRALGSHPDGQAVEVEAFDISEHRDLLQPGRNLLALHGLNASETSSDFLLAPELRGGQAADSAVVLDETTTLRARTRSGSEWSALVETTFFVDEPLPLRVTEVMFHPPDPLGTSPWTDDDFEFVELRNAGGRRLSLKGVEFTEGIRYDFDDGAQDWLAPGEVVLLVRNRDAFATRYGPGLPVIGAYDGRLDNTGERLRIEGPLGETVVEFAWTDVWYPVADGQGASLEIVDDLASPDTWSRPEGWVPSAKVLGTPGLHGDGPAGGLQRAGDLNQDGRYDISDPIGLLRRLFSGEGGPLPCDGASLGEGGNLALLDLNGDAAADLSDAIYGLSWLFTAGPPPVQGTGCVRIEACPDACPP